MNADAPEQPEEVSRRIRLVRRDMGGLLFHFTRDPAVPFVEVALAGGAKSTTPGSAAAVLRKILYDGKLLGTGTWAAGRPCVSFTEAPIEEFAAVFRLVEIAASKIERPRYEPYGIAVSKPWLFALGGRPVIYDHPDARDALPESHRYRYVPYGPQHGIDTTWEREWRIQTDALALDPKHALVVVPTADEAFEIVYGFADMEAEYDDGMRPLARTTSRSGSRCRSISLASSSVRRNFSATRFRLQPGRYEHGGNGAT